MAVNNPSQAVPNLVGLTDQVLQIESNYGELR
jgi:hypothetical protein